MNSFEEAFGRLEQILEKMNSEGVSLDDSMKLYEEADKLINSCTKRLTEAEKRIETLVKDRDGQPQLDESGEPVTAPFEV
jgi:exodeoxyribonuclease VII small subunit